jgi:pentatricopeptide repeat protein
MTFSRNKQFLSTPLRLQQQSFSHSSIHALLTNNRVKKKKSKKKQTTSEETIRVNAISSIRDTLIDIQSSTIENQLKKMSSPKYTLKNEEFIQIFNTVVSEEAVTPDIVKQLLLMAEKVQDLTLFENMVDRSLRSIEKYYIKYGGALLPSDLLFSIITFYLKKNKSSHALSIYIKLKQYEELTPLLLNHFTNLAIRQKLFKFSDRLFADANESNIQFDKSHWQYTISAYVQVSQFTRAMQVFEYMNKMNMPLDVPILTLLLENIKKHSASIPEGKSYMEYIIDYIGTLEQTSNERLFSAVLAAIGELGNIRAAQKWFRHLIDSEVAFDQRSVNGVLIALAKNGMFDEAFTFVREVEKKFKIAPNTVTYNTLLNYANTTEQLSSVITALKKHKSTMNIISYSTIIKVLCKHTMVREAINVYEIMKSEGVTPNHITIHTLLYACKKDTETISMLFNDYTTLKIDPGQALPVAFTLYSPEFRETIIDLVISQTGDIILEYAEENPDVLPTLLLMLYKEGDKRVANVSKKLKGIGLNITPGLTGVPIPPQ